MRWLPALFALGALGIPFAALGLFRGVEMELARPMQGPWTRPLSVRRADRFPRTFVNAAGETALVRSVPQRVVSGTIFSDTTLLAICPGGRIRALHELSRDPNYSAIAAESAAFPRHVDGSPEGILAERPDLVIVSSFSRKETHNLLSREGCAVVRFLGFSAVEDIQNNIRALGYVLDLDDAAEALVVTMQQRLAQVATHRDAAQRWRLLHWDSGRTSARATSFDSLLQWVGARNAALELGLTGYPAIRAEEVIALDPDAIVIGVGSEGEAATRARLTQVPGFTTLRAVRNERVITVSNALLLSTAHDVVAAAERIAEVLAAWGRP